MSKATRSARAAAAPAGTIAANPEIIIKDKPVILITRDEPGSKAKLEETLGKLTADDLATLPLLIRNTSKGMRTTVERGQDGSWHRFGGSLRIQIPVGLTERHYVITLAKGANEDDLNFFMRAVNRARAGETDGGWRKIKASWADKQSFVYVFTGRPYSDPYTHKDASPSVMACAEPLCVDKWHAADGVDEPAWHTHETIAKKLPSQRGEYEIQVRRLDPDDEWTVDVYVAEFFGTTQDMTAFVNDLQWAQQSCDRANNKAQTA